MSGACYREVPNETPTGVSVFPNDFRPVRAFAHRSNNIVHWSQMDRGGTSRHRTPPTCWSRIYGRSSAGSGDETSLGE